MSKDFIEEIELRRAAVEKIDFDVQSRNIEHFRSYWLHMILLSSAIVIGVLPIINEESNVIKSLTLAELGLLLIICMCVLLTLYFGNVLAREKSLAFDKRQFHGSVFSSQITLIKRSREAGKNEAEIQRIFADSKLSSFIEENSILQKHLLGGKFAKLRLFVDRYFNRIVSILFTLGIMFVIFSFILNIG